MQTAAYKNYCEYQVFTCEKEGGDGSPIGNKHKDITLCHCHLSSAWVHVKLYFYKISLTKDKLLVSNKVKD